jgi:hypothetical protein
MASWESVFGANPLNEEADPLASDSESDPDSGDEPDPLASDSESDPDSGEEAECL